MKKTKFLTIVTLLLVLVCAMATFAVTACGSGVTVSLSVTELKLVEGGKGNVIVTTEGTEEAVTWEISDEAVASFNVVGKVCSVTAKKEGEATLTASVGDVKATCTVKVSKNDTETVTVTLNGEACTDMEVEIGANKTLVATASKGSAITWETSNENIATVENGKVTGVHAGTAKITAKVSASIKAEVNVTVKAAAGTTDEYYEMENTGAIGALDTPDKWTYYSGWAITEDDPVPVYDNGTVKLTFSNNTGAWYAMQLFYKQTDLTEGQLYKLNFDVNTTKGGKVTINGVVKTLAQGDNAVEIYYTERHIAYDGPNQYPITFQMLFSTESQPDGDIDAATVEIKNMKWTPYTATPLQAPDFSLTGSDGDYTINITDTNAAADVGGYRLNFYSNDTLTGSVKVTNGQKINLTTMKSGTYTVKLVAEAASKKNTESQPSAKTAEITVNNAKTDYVFGEQNNINSIPNTWIYWNDQNWCGTNVAVTEHYIDANGGVHLTYSGAAYACWFGMQLFYKDSNLTEGQEYTLTLKINASEAGDITVNNQVVTLVKGDNDVSLECTQGALASIIIQFGKTEDGNSGPVIAGGSFVLSDIACTPKA